MSFVGMARDAADGHAGFHPPRRRPARRCRGDDPEKVGDAAAGEDGPGQQTDHGVPNPKRDGRVGRQQGSRSAGGIVKRDCAHNAEHLFSRQAQDR